MICRRLPGFWSGRDLEGVDRVNLRKRLHFIGIGGVGMSGIAKICLEMGENVSGSDMAASVLTQQLEDLGAAIHLGHDGALISDEVSAVVVSTAIHPDNPELQEAIRREIPIIRRGEYLARLMDHKDGIAVAGAHGKTTTSAMIALLLKNGGLDSAFLVGAYVDNLKTNAQWGQGRFMVAEADESDGSFLKLNPWITLVTNVEDDHLDYYGTRENINAAFIKFIEHTPSRGCAILCLDDPTLASLLPDIEAGRILTYGFRPDAWLRGENVRCEDGRMLAEVFRGGQRLGTLSLKVPGKHNVLNALGAVAAGLECGMDFQTISDILAGFSGAHRRFEWIGEVRDIKIFDDYAHHPTELKATLEAARLLKPKRIFAVFQPHRYTRTQLLADEFGGAFAEADRLVLLPVYAAGENPIPGVSSDLIASAVMAQTGAVPMQPADFDETVQTLCAALMPGDLLLTLGAGSVGKLGPMVLAALQALDQE